MDQSALLSALLWVLGIFATVLIGVAVGLFVHVKEDAKVHERVATLEERTNTQGEEVGKLRDMRHEIIEQCSRSISDFYINALKRVDELKEWVRERVK